MAEITGCPICKSGDAQIELLGELRNKVQIDCPTCGRLLMAELTALGIIEKVPTRNLSSAVLSYNARKMQSNGSERITITEKLINDFLQRNLPTASEQADNFVLWVGDRTEPGQRLKINHNEVYAQVGSHFREGLGYIIHNLTPDFVMDEGGDRNWVRLTFKGWDRYQALKRGRSDSKRAFMAMKFNDPVLDSTFNCFRSAVAETGFTLMRLDEKPKAGLIDNRLRVEIRTSRFLVVDLTDDNAGAYWEGGFAEGLGKPVFYSCERMFFKKHKTHFDTNHSHTVIWDASNLNKAAEELKASIRATLPDEAKMTD